MRVSVLCHLVTLINISVSLVPTSMSGRSHKLAGRLMMSFEPCDDAEPRRGSSKAVLGRIDDLVNAAPVGRLVHHGIICFITLPRVHHEATWFIILPSELPYDRSFYL